MVLERLVKLMLTETREELLRNNANKSVSGYRVECVSKGNGYYDCVHVYKDVVVRKSHENT